MKTEVGKVLIDFAKLIFGSVILTGIMRQNVSPAILFIFGGIATGALVGIGLLIIWIDKIKK